MTNITAVIMAAGLGSRMGKNKLALPWQNNKTVLETTIERVSSSAVANGIIVLGYQCDFWLNRLDLPKRWQTVINKNFAMGQSTSLLKGLSVVEEDTAAILFCLGDQPLVKTETIDYMLKNWQERRCPILIPTYKGIRGNPTIFGRSTFGDMKNLQGDVGARSLFMLYPPIELPVEDRGIVVDLDKPEIYEAERRKLDC
ncbi:MAG: nucleotidyltransferase family protein [Clostridia bacterium]|jgi:molybdenum cofactor cytidylyltransferase|nr:nucleotidyltransferase family protein [Clostridia bacterium]MDD4571687.1 nucleotidyltransferase family protein [Clostridia bacterium]